MNEPRHADEFETGAIPKIEQPDIYFLNKLSNELKWRYEKALEDDNEDVELSQDILEKNSVEQDLPMVEDDAEMGKPRDDDLTDIDADLSGVDLEDDPGKHSNLN
ncbi:hypothetical protein HDU76_011164 [Blyttiomyces sp. JEL0837]|nr:hypothetical protein HDU76_011164 [Blyttiomyces sp. JEL0837]